MMQAPPGLDQYSNEELDRAESWPAIERYRQLLLRQATDPRSIADRDPKDQLRLRRHELWLRCALATFFDRVPAKDVCLFWSAAAEELLLRAWQLSGCDKSNLTLLALGKLGSEELNLSSDVDLIVLRTDEQTPDMKAFRDFQALLSELTELGFCLRLDFTLRPGGRSGAVIPSISEFEYHYGYHGEMWERLAYVRMRILTGPADSVAEIGNFARKFSFRKHLDYTLLDELKTLRTKIRTEKAELRLGWFHLKLGEGGIRELELFVHALQVMHGGRNPILQTHSTTAALEHIRALKLLPAKECEFLIGAYWHLRTLENKLQAFEDQQSYSVDLERGNAALPEGFAPELKKLCQRVSKIATSLFGTSESESTLPEEPEDQKIWLKQHGFNAFSCEETWPALASATALSRRSDADEKERLTFLRGFVTTLAEVGLDRDLGLSLLLDFVKAIRAKASFFTLLNRETRVRTDLASFFSVSPYLGGILASRPELIDEFIFRKQAEPSTDFNLLLDELAERRLLSELISANQFLADRDLRKMTLNLTANADAICLTLLERLKSELGASDLSLVSMGKWGGRELGLRSDLDFVFVTPAAPTPEDHKLARRFLSRLTEPHRGGSIYAVDMRLRPSGNAGPIMVEGWELEKYILMKAAPWERQAYLRSRTLFSDGAGHATEGLDFQPGALAAKRGLSPEDRVELGSIRKKLFIESFGDGLDLKLSLGGLADVEFTAQIALLDHREFSLDPSTSGMIQYLESIDAKWKAIGPEVRENYESLRLIEQLFQLTTSQSGSKMRVKSDEFRRLALVLGSTPVELEARVKSLFTKNSAALQEVRVI